MKYFCTEKERKGTLYHEFQKGKWDNETFWRDDSLLLHDDVFIKLDLYEFFIEFIPGYATYGETEISKEQWKEICEKADLLGGEIKEAMAEADKWASGNFENEEVFTILGI